MVAAFLFALAAILLVPSGRRSLGLRHDHDGAARPRATPSPLFIATFCSVPTIVVIPWPMSVIAGPGVFVGGYLLAQRIEPASRRRKRARLQSQMPQVVDLMSASLAAGAAPSFAFGVVASVVAEPMRSELGELVGRLRLGADPSDIWAAMSDDPQLGPLGRALARATEVGAPIQESLERLADELRALRRTTVMVKARSVQTKAAAPLGACLLPAFLFLAVVPLVASQFLSLGTL